MNIWLGNNFFSTFLDLETFWHLALEKWKYTTGLAAHDPNSTSVELISLTPHGGKQWLVALTAWCVLTITYFDSGNQPMTQSNQMLSRSWISHDSRLQIAGDLEQVICYLILLKQKARNHCASLPPFSKLRPSCEDVLDPTYLASGRATEPNSGGRTLTNLQISTLSCRFLGSVRWSFLSTA